jgi:DNA-binding response OmpR family regulator
MKTVLVIEDNEEISALLVDQLAEAGYSTTALKNGMEVVGYLLKKEGADPDAIILDLMLPGRSGVELLGSIRSAFASVKIFIYSSHKEYFSLIPKHCVDGFILKTDGARTVVGALDKIFHKSPAHKKS